MIKSKNKKLNDFMDVLIAFLIAISIYFGLSLIMKTSMPVVTVVSDSMLPTLHVGDLLLVDNLKKPEIGDIVVYKVSVINYPIVHRIIGKKFVNGRYGYIIKGDNNEQADPFVVMPEDIIGKVYLSIPMLGYPRYLIYLPFKKYDESHFFKKN